MAGDVPETVRDLTPSGPPSARALDERRERGQLPDGPHGDAERDGVDQIQLGQTDDGDEHTREQRADDLPGLHHGGAQRVGGGQLGGGHQPGDGGAARRGVHAPEGLLCGEQHHQQGHRPRPGERLRPQQQGGDGEARVCDQHQLAPVHAVRDRPAPQGEDDERYQSGEARVADPGRGAGDVVDLLGHGHGGELAADSGDGGRGPQPAVGRVPQRPGVHHQPAPSGPLRRRVRAVPAVRDIRDVRDAGGACTVRAARVLRGAVVVRRRGGLRGFLRDVH